MDQIKMSNHSRGAKDAKFLKPHPPPCIFTHYICLESLGVVDQCLRGCGALRRTVVMEIALKNTCLFCETA